MKRRRPINLGTYPWIADTVYQLATNSAAPIMVQFRDEILTEKIKTEHPFVAVYLTGSDPGAEVILRAMRAGASEFLTRPVSGTDLSAAMKKIATRIQQETGSAGQVGEIVTVFSNKGGVGTTTIATNLALMRSASIAAAASHLLQDKGICLPFDADLGLLHVPR